MNKLKSIICFVILAAGTVVAASAHPDHDHAKKKVGANGGRILTSSDPHAEFWVMPDKRVQITFLNDRNEPMPLGTQSVVVTTGQRTAPVTLTFERKGNALVSNQALATNKQPAVVQIKSTPDSKAAVARFTIDLSLCGECQHAEYACTCGHAH